ncbi:hypothetical protein [Hwanghaeella sp. LZ110]|jgi:hypothetical protein|uniref:hypothetical protein n=1 Tax=Hwanghaeella sp. LZ110 TaxID=3402810 RepID=UPI003B683E56
MSRTQRTAISGAAFATTIRKSRDIAMIIPVVFTLLIMKPMIHLFGPEPGLAGIPAIVVYLFGLWTLAVVLTAWNARRLNTPETNDPLVMDPQDSPP